MGLLDKFFGYFSGNSEGDTTTTTEPTQAVAQEKPIPPKKPEMQLGIQSSVPVYPQYSEVVGNTMGGMDVGSYMQKLAQEEEQKLINMAANVPEKTLPTDYYSTEPQQAIQGYTSGVTGVNMPIIGSPLAQKYPYALADERRRSQLNAAMLRLEKRKRDNAPMNFTVPQTYQGWTAKLENHAAQFADEFSKEIARTPNGFEQLKIQGTPLNNKFREFQNFLNMKATYGREVGEMAIKIKSDDEAPEWQKNLANGILEDPNFLLNPKNQEVAYGLTKYPAYSKIVTDMADQLWKSADITPEGGLDLKRLGGGLLAALPSEVKQVEDERLTQAATLIYDQNPNLVRYSLMGKNIDTRDGAIKEIKNNLDFMLGKQTQQKYMNVSQPRKISIGEDGSPDAYYPSVVGFYKDEKNLQKITDTFVDVVGSSNNPQDLNRNMAKFNDFTDSKGNRYITAPTTGYVNENDPITVNLFGGQKPPIEGKTNTFTIGQIYKVLQNQGDKTKTARLINWIKEADDDVKKLVTNNASAKEINAAIENSPMWDTRATADVTDVKGVFLQKDTYLPYSLKKAIGLRVMGQLDGLRTARPGAQISYVINPERVRSGEESKNVMPTLSFDDYSSLDVMGQILGLESQMGSNTKKSFKVVLEE